jgi:hypothetical protein
MYKYFCCYSSRVTLIVLILNYIVTGLKTNGLAKGVTWLLQAEPTATEIFIT